MFARLSTVFLLALPVLVSAGPTHPTGGGNCSSGQENCCNSVQDAKDANVAKILTGLLGVAAQGITGQVGVTCTPVTVLGVSGQSCNRQTVCCDGNNFNGIVAVGCTPVNVNL